MNSGASGVGILLLSGSDPSALSHLVSETQSELLGDQDSSLAVTRFSLAEYAAEGAAASLGVVVEACMTPPMFTPYRVVVVREMGICKSADLEPLLDYLKNPMPTTKLLLVWEKPAVGGRSERLPAALSNAVKSAGGVFRAADPAQGNVTGKAWLKKQREQAKVKLDKKAFDLLVDRLGEDRTRIWGILDALYGTYGEGPILSSEDVEPFIGEAGSVPPWELTDAISTGDYGRSQDQLARMLSSGGRHPLQILASLHGYFERILRLDGAGVRNKADAATLLRKSGAMNKSGSTYPAEIAFEASKELRGWKIRRVYELLAAADLDLRGRSGAPASVVLEVLVARLVQLHPKQPSVARGRTSDAGSD